MLVAYFDESGTHGKASRVTTVAGLLGHTTYWHRLELPWKKRLAAIEPALGSVATYHATDCANQDKDFRKFSKADSETLAIDLATLIADRDELIAIGAAVYRDEWEYCASPKLKSQFRTPYHFCLTMALMQICDVSRNGANSDPVALVFAKQGEYDDYSKAIHEIAYESDRFRKYLGNFSFGQPRCVIQLQAADLFSYETYRELLTQLDEPELKMAKREPLRIIDKKIRNECAIAGLEMLHKFSDGLDRLG